VPTLSTRKRLTFQTRKKMTDSEKPSVTPYEEVLRRDGRLIFTPGGTSMHPMLKSHENPVIILPVTPDTRLKKYDVVFYRRKNGQYVLHRIVSCQKDGSFVMCGDGQYYTEKKVTRDMIFGILEGYYKGEKYITLSGSFRYALYSFFRVNTLPVRSFFYRLYKYICRRLKK